MSFFPVTFASVPFPADFLSLGNILRFFSVDLFSIFGASSCDFSAGFYSSFMFSFLIFPVIATYGPIETWDTSEVTNMRYVFRLKKNINPDIQNWIVDSVVNMEGMFQDTDSFNIDPHLIRLMRVTQVQTIARKVSTLMVQYTFVQGINLCSSLSSRCI